MRQILEIERVPRFSHSMILEGGSIHVDGEGMFQQLSLNSPHPFHVINGKCLNLASFCKLILRIKDETDSLDAPILMGDFAAGRHDPTSSLEMGNNFLICFLLMAIGNAWVLLQGLVSQQKSVS